MKFLFASSDVPEVVSFKNALVRAGIPCEIVQQNAPPMTLDKAVHPELWIQNEEDFVTASMLFASRRRRAQFS